MSTTATKRYKNVAKQQYAIAYRAWLTSGRVGKEPSRGQLSFMGAQAVRLDLQVTSN